MAEERHFSHSSMSTWRECRAKYKWSYVNNYEQPSSLGQVRGSAGHAALANWYTKFNEEEAVAVASEQYSERERRTGEDLSEDWELLELILRRYFDWSRNYDDFTEIVSLEQKFEFRINNHMVIGYIDGVVKTGDTMWLLENKFNKRVEISGIDLDAQVSVYMMACYKLGINVAGVMYNIIRVSEGGVAIKQPVVRRKIFRNQEGLAFIEKEMAIQLDEMARFHDQGGAVYRTPTRDCAWKCGFYKACLSLNDDGDLATALSSYPITLYDEPLKGVDGE